MSLRFLAFLVYTAAALAQTAHEPSTYEFGFEQRVRNEDWNNQIDFNDRTDDEREQVRYRTRVWMRAPLSHTIDVYVGLNQETNQRMGQKNRFDEVVFETAYLDFKRLFVDGLALRVGRQNIMKGEGFVFLEGNTWDGSRSIYFNAANLSYTRGKAKVEMIGILNPSRDRMLPRFHDQHKMLTEWDESALGTYFTHAAGLEAYYFYKRETNCLLPVTSVQYQPDRHVHTLGARGVRKVAKDWTATGELAAQWGGDALKRSIGAWGGYGHIRRVFSKHAWKPYLLTGYWAMSGDDPSTKDKIEGWDPLFSRWPKYSEGYLYTLMREKGPGYWTNLGMWQAEAGATPKKSIGLRLTYYRMNSFHPYAGDRRIFAEGTRRGDNLQARMDFVVGRNWRAHALYETHMPGSFYQTRNTGYFLRFEVSYLITGQLKAQDLAHALAGR